LLLASQRSSSPFSSTTSKRAARHIPEQIKSFYKPDGKLFTTSENIKFLRDHDIEPDAGVMDKMVPPTFNLNALASRFSTRFLYHPGHVLTPRQLEFFDPRGHPLRSARLADIGHKSRTEPLWIIVTSVDSAPAAVRITSRFRLRASLYIALRERGYDKCGRALPGSGNKDLRGTLVINVHNAVKAAAQPKELFGNPIVRALEELRDGPLTRAKRPAVAKWPNEAKRPQKR
jgi:hypothetical protein